jgi:hypothetical protein
VSKCGRLLLFVYFPSIDASINLEPAQSGYTPGNLSSVAATANPDGVPIVTPLDYTQEQRRGAAGNIVYYTEYNHLSGGILST